MKQMRLWMLATILTSWGLMMLSSCSNEDDTDTPPMDEVESQLRGKDGADLNIALAS